MTAKRLGAVALIFSLACAGSALAATAAVATPRALVLRAGGQRLHGARPGEPESGSPLLASASSFELAPNTASCSGGTIEGEVESLRQPRRDVISLISQVSLGPCSREAVYVEFGPILLKSDGSVHISGTVEVKNPYGTRFYRLTHIKGGFPVNEGSGEAPLVLRIANQSAKLENGSPAPCQHKVLLSGTFSLSSGGRPVIATLE